MPCFLSSVITTQLFRIQEENRPELRPHDFGVAQVSIQMGFVTLPNGANETEGTLTHFCLTFNLLHDSQLCYAAC